MKLKIAILILIVALAICLAPLSQTMPALAADNVTVDSVNNVNVEVDVIVQAAPTPPSLPDPPAPPAPPTPPAPPVPPAPAVHPYPKTPPAPVVIPAAPKPVIQFKLPPLLPKFNNCCNTCCDPCCNCVSTCVTVCPPCPASWDCHGCCDCCDCYCDTRDCYDCQDCCDSCQTTKVVVVKPQQTVCPPVISSFTANPSCVQACQDVVLTWTASNTEKVSIYPGIGVVPNTGSYKVSLCSTTTYTLSASNSDGTVSASTTVTVVPSVSTYNIGGQVSGGTSEIATADTSSIFTSWFKDAKEGNNSKLLFILLIALLAAAAAAIVIFARKPALARAGNRSSTMVGYLPWATATMERTETPKTSAATAVGTAKFTTADGVQILIPGNGGVLGRDDFHSVVPPSKVNLISREHIRVNYEDGKYYIEDLKSTNGTKINASGISAKSKILLNDGDAIVLADVLTLTFRT